MNASDRMNQATQLGRDRDHVIRLAGQIAVALIAQCDLKQGRSAAGVYEVIPAESVRVARAILAEVDK